MDIRSDAYGRVTVDAASYSLSIDPSGPWLEIEWANDRVRLGAGAGTHGGTWRFGDVSDGAEPVARLLSDDGRRVTFEFRPELVLVQAEIPELNGDPTVLTGPGLPLFADIFSPEPTALRKVFFGPEERAVTSISSDLAYFRGHWIFSPPPFCFAVGGGTSRVAVGVADDLSALQFTSFEYDGGGFLFRYDHPVNTAFTAPRLVLIPVEGDGYRAVEAYCDFLRREGLAPSGTGRKRPDWWAEPAFCGWGEQSYLRVRNSHYPMLGIDPKGADRYYLPDGIPSNSTQSGYEEAMVRLEAEGLNPGVVTIDDKWQIANGLGRPDESRWPDIKGFIDRQHALGRHVLLWWKLWDGEGLPADELLGGGPYPVVDPTSQEYRRRLFHEMEYALWHLGGDGLKIDILHRGPVRSHRSSRSGIMGVRLHLEMLRLLRDAALAAKEEALLVAHAANPYFADVADVVRLNDVSTIPGNPSFVEDMRHRARLARAACPEALIDTDNWPCPDRKQWREYVATQPEIGIPALYYATGIDLSNEPLQPEDYDLVRDAWRRWREKKREGREG